MGFLSARANLQFLGVVQCSFGNHAQRFLLHNHISRGQKRALDSRCRETKAYSIFLINKIIKYICNQCFSLLFKLAQIITNIRDQYFLFIAKTNSGMLVQLKIFILCTQKMNNI